MSERTSTAVFVLCVLFFIVGSAAVLAQIDVAGSGEVVPMLKSLTVVLTVSLVLAYFLHALEERT